ncbi:hypothetical protein L6Q96_06295 [Candidatus Binatia bacterium]|nr:hypothetical protein [Candidatus Binatia bacterium]
MSARIDNPPTFWFRWLVVATIGVTVFGASMMLAPGLIRAAFGLLTYGSTDALEAFGPEAAAYISFAHGIIGAVMVGWGVALLFVILGPFRRGSREAWLTVAVSLAAWFVPDTIFSVWTGFWPNAILNASLAVVFLIPLAATYGGMDRR